MCSGFWTVDVPPSPNDQFQLVGDLVERSVNFTGNGTEPIVRLPVKSGCGAKPYIVICIVIVLLVTIGTALLLPFVGVLL